ncbi:hypothetical protein KC343_g12539 [Hortaea werneckii]|nr:hypothetical protein KC338_g6419 [Hortaea werneckii]KAI7183419.1 hypothetical protein KC352_g22969 [Hortaea werneckii]KAI7347857.1 hypothetical protein KC320_g6991 [Hortaea werneckii]KAI7555771.1 hypothetical protein KC317_g12723 [Hortaea werneckii]KAI7602184.1 hypothetical protein KC346_g12481 [Hortaea werneckii]
MATNQVAYFNPPSVADLEAAVAQTSLNNVFTILAKWEMPSQMSDESGTVSSTKVMPVKEAISAGHVANFQAFLWHGWDVNEPVEHDGPSALGYAVKDRHLASWLLANGAEPNAGFQYDTPISRAALSGNVEMVELLLSHGGNVKRGQVLHWAVERHECTCDVLTILLERGAPPDEMGFGGVLPIWSVLQVLATPLHKAVALDKQDVVEKLLEYGADPDKKDTSGKTAKGMPVDLGRKHLVSLMQC